MVGEVVGDTGYGKAGVGATVTSQDVEVPPDVNLEYNDSEDELSCPAVADNWPFVATEGL